MNTRRPLTTAVIVTYNSRGHINDALAALRVAHEAGSLDCVVVDNVSSDGTADFVAAAHPWVTLIRSGRNLGFGRGCNLGFQQVNTPYVLIHNPDAVLKQQALQIMVDFIETHPQAGIVAPAIVEGERSLQAAGLLTTPASLLRAALGMVDALPDEQRIIPGNPPFATSWVCGAMMLIRSELYRRLGGFDPRFFLYFEETDFCRRAALEGAEIWAVGEAVARHLGGACAKATGQSMESFCISEHYYRSRFYYLVKHFGWVTAVGTETLVWLGQVARHGRNRIAGRQSLSPFTNNRPFLRLPSLPDDTP